MCRSVKKTEIIRLVRTRTPAPGPLHAALAHPWCAAQSSGDELLDYMLHGGLK